MDDSHPKRSIADDPAFLASLKDLDRGLVDEGEIEKPPRDVRPQAWPPPPPAEPPEAPPPTEAPRRSAPIAFPQQPPLQSLPAPTDRHAGPVARRPLLDLFPPPPMGHDVAPAPTFGGASPAPRLARSRSLGTNAAAEPVAALTYETFYGLTTNPFAIPPDPKFVYHSAAHDRAAQELVDAIGRGEGIVVLTGRVGTGKTTLCREVIDQLDRRTVTSLVSEPFVTVDDLLKTVLVDFGVISRADLTGGRLAAATRAELTATLKGFLGSLVALQASALLIIDDAHTLPLEALEQFRVLSDTAGAERLQVVLVGSRELLTVVNRRELRRLNQHITVRIEIGTLVADEIPGYVMHRLAVSGTGARVEFDDGAFEKLFALSSGVPRVVNVLCDRALTLGHKASASVIDASLIADAAKSLDLAPRSVESRRLLQSVVFILGFLALMAGGGAGALWTFRDQVSVMIEQWAAIPPAPEPPGLRLPQPLAPIPPPEDSGLDR